MSAPKEIRTIATLTFPPDVSGQPVVCNLSRVYDVCFNILQSRIDPREEGHMTIELIGSADNIDKGLSYLQSHGVKVAPVPAILTRDEESCMHCGLCTAMCPSRALAVDPETRLIVFRTESCTACGMCVKLCPVKAMAMRVDEEAI